MFSAKTINWIGKITFHMNIGLSPAHKRS